MLTYWSYLLFNKLNFSLNCINSTLLKFYFCFHSMIVFVVSLFLWGDKNGTKSEYILLKFHHFTCLKQNPLKNRLFLTFTITKPKGFVNYSWSKVIQTFIICENWCCYFFFYHFSCLCSGLTTLQLPVGDSLYDHLISWSPVSTL